MPKSSSVDLSRLSFRAAAVLFAAATAFFVWLFVNRLTSEREIRTGVITYALVTGICAVGLWMQRQWGRSVALLISLASAGLGTLALLSVILSREGSMIAPAITFVASVAFAFWLSRPVFGGLGGLPRDDGV